MKLKFKRADSKATLPTYATDGSACIDIYACLDGSMVLAPGGGITVDTGLICEVPEGHVLLLFSRSGHGFNYNTRLSNCVGVIDADYRGRIIVKLRRDPTLLATPAPLTVSHGDRIAQALLVPIPRVECEWADELSDTQRGAGGFGSTGK